MGTGPALVRHGALVWPGDVRTQDGIVRAHPAARRVQDHGQGRAFSHPAEGPGQLRPGARVGGPNIRVNFDYSDESILRGYEQSLQRLSLPTADAPIIHDLDHGYHDDATLARHLSDLKEGGLRVLEELKARGEIRLAAWGEHRPCIRGGRARGDARLYPARYALHAARPRRSTLLEERFSIPTGGSGSAQPILKRQSGTAQWRACGATGAGPRTCELAQRRLRSLNYNVRQHASRHTAASRAS